MLSCINDYKDAVWSIREREKKIMEAVQRCFFKNILTSTEVNMDLICTIMIDIRIIHDIFKYQLKLFIIMSISWL